MRCYCRLSGRDGDYLLACSLSTYILGISCRMAVAVVRQVNSKPSRGHLRGKISFFHDSTSVRHHCSCYYKQKRGCWLRCVRKSNVNVCTKKHIHTAYYEFQNSATRKSDISLYSAIHSNVFRCWMRIFIKTKVFSLFAFSTSLFCVYMRAPCICAFFVVLLLWIRSRMYVCVISNTSIRFQFESMCPYVLCISKNTEPN